MRKNRVGIVFFRNAALTAVAVSLSGCGLLGRCNYEQRYVRAAGKFIQDGAELASAEITVGATRGGLQWRDIDWYIKVPHEGAVISMTLVLSSQPTPILLDLPLANPITPYVYVSALIQRKEELTPALGGIFEMVAGEGALLEIRTDVPARPLIRIPLVATEKRDWYRSHNCY